MKRSSTFKDITGHQLGPLVVLKDAGTQKQGKHSEVLWLCLCTLCGSEKLFPKCELQKFKKGKRKSCGCREHAHYRSPEESKAHDKFRSRLRNRKASYRYACTRSRARRTGMEFSIALAEYKKLLEQPCHYCGGPLPEVGAGLDRIDSKVGYIPTNVRPCCWPCNTGKNKMPEKAFREWVVKVYNNWANVR